MLNIGAKFLISLFSVFVLLTLIRFIVPLLWKFILWTIMGTLDGLGVDTKKFALWVKSKVPRRKKKPKQVEEEIDLLKQRLQDLEYLLENPNLLGKK